MEVDERVRGRVRGGVLGWSDRSGGSLVPVGDGESLVRWSRLVEFGGGDDVMHGDERCGMNG